MPNTSVTPLATSVSTKASEGVMRVLPETTVRWIAASLPMVGTSRMNCRGEHYIHHPRGISDARLQARGTFECRQFAEGTIALDSVAAIVRMSDASILSAALNSAPGLPSPFDSDQQKDFP